MFRRLSSRMKKAAIPAILLALVFPLAALAAVHFPVLTGRVVDDAGILKGNIHQEIEAKLAAHEQSTGEQLVVVTLRSLAGMPIEDYGYQLGRAWGIGQKGKDNGALLIVAPKERKVRIEAGYGLEGRLTDAIDSMIISEVILPHFRKGDYAGGIDKGVEAILAVLDKDAVPGAAQTQAQQPPHSLPAAIFVILAIFLLLRAMRGGGIIAPLILGGMLSGSGRSDGGFGGFSGGGGGFGGGGASGSW